MKSKVSTLNRDGRQISPWQRSVKTSIPVMHANERTVYDVLIVGAGITGLTAALKLQTAGKRTVVAEAFTIGYGTTGGTSAHINTFADTTYTEAESAFGEEGAKLFKQAILDGYHTITDNVAEYKINCDLETRPGYVYAEDDEQEKQLKDLYDGATKVGVAIEYVNEVPVKVPYQKAVMLDGQAQFDPLKYLSALANEYLKAGGVILQHTMVNEVQCHEGVHTATTANGTIKASNVIYATHMPPHINVFNMKCAPYRSYVLGVELVDHEDVPDALIYDLQEPYHYFRSHVVNGQKLLLVGGNDHKTGHDDPEQAFDDLENYVRQYYNVKSVVYKWSSQYYVPVDGLPYVGQMPLQADGTYCATGYNGNGMMLGSVSGAILADMILGNENPLTELFNAKRMKPIDGFTEFIKENADVAYHFVADKFKGQHLDSFNELEPGTGKLIDIDGQKLAAYKDDAGKVHALSPVCTHMGCNVAWNACEKSWDCPCHGARYDIDGKVVTGPATKDLEQIELPETSN
ncbi:FAD-dependent oxidoreductase [Mucilaginibacter daejeonensis]|uniref:FAD-dependent oxidoreductase n=1 Tax=Mucilaginibacter daejeonensis TaxID=398049 RepID=UPI001D177DCC|nr:FAD-dependent oxidoreductase [Mucilaginibacter daejeonensis]UEG54772.1 FAD-dependent oxidoreductase [Mucilaginibacter daejeonensis]